MKSQKLYINTPLILAQLSNLERNRLNQILFHLHCRICPTNRQEQFKRFLESPEARKTKVFLFENTHGDIVGYLIGQTRKVSVGNRSQMVFQYAAGTLGAYQNHPAVQKLIRREYTLFKTKNLFRKVSVRATANTPYELQLNQGPATGMAIQTHFQTPQYSS